MINTMKIAALIAFAAAFAVIYAVKTEPTTVMAETGGDPAVIYKAKCALCHGKKAEKGYKADMPEEEQVTAILKGKKATKPPHMPGFEKKGVTQEDAKALVTYMKGLKTPAE